MGVAVVQVLDYTLGPLEALFAERASAVQSHHCRQVLQLLALLCAYLQDHISQNKSNNNTYLKTI